MTEPASSVTSRNPIDLLSFIHEYQRLTGKTPSLGAIRDAVRPDVSRETVRALLSALENLGLITRAIGGATTAVRQICVTEQGLALIALLGRPSLHGSADSASRPHQSA